MINREQIEQRLAELTAARQRHAQKAQRVDYGYAAAIGELERLLAPAEPPPPELDLDSLAALQEEGNPNA